MIDVVETLRLMWHTVTFGTGNPVIAFFAFLFPGVLVALRILHTDSEDEGELDDDLQ